MTTPGLLLLPTQEALVQRLQHIASYGEQLLVICGDKGSGKSTLTAALASELDDYNCALIICPQHADSAEIRRKILVQLISAPIFDDERPLMDTVLRIQSSLTKPLHIIIDDADLLPKDIWAECILLSQIHCAGKPVAVTVTVTPSFWYTLVAELTDDIRARLLPVTIEPLSVPERDGLYQSLLLRSEQAPFIPREIIHKQLEKQQGTPAEVVQLLALALEEPQTEKPSWSLSVKLFVILAVISVFVAIGAAVNSQLPVPISTSLAPTLTAEQSIVRVKAQQYVAHFADTTLSAYFAKRQLALTKSTANKQALVLFDKQMAADTSLGERNLSDVNDNTAPDNHSDVTVSSSIKGLSFQGKLPKAQIQAVVQPSDIVENDNNPNLKVQGFTLQLASVNDKASLAPILAKMAQEPQVYVMSYQQRYVLLLGDFDTVTVANLKAKSLQTQYSLAAPWVRKWADLSDYKRQD
ncbi:AAA family ATPase [Shewanella sp. Actino-trap-3]|uniref:ATP-binding protein n=1 Tax=Shewanella sp. Actino-trap-3 TaxID=2058331 RepID=UPI000C348553|nr:ATP-binding protein [Shewanella sp. Actino-trap-3]PKG78947.1 AAA family ATPase [Shewanella sp. Actino-trap-3]